jgi:hypothetical protein
MLNELAAASFYKDGDCPEQPWSFTCKEGDVRCLGYIINLAVQDVLKQLKAVLSDISETYRIDANKARIPVSHSQDEVVSALSKLRRHVYIFRNQQGFKSWLEQHLKATGMKQRLLVLDMLIRWNSTYDMINVACIQESLLHLIKHPIRANGGEGYRSSRKFATDVRLCLSLTSTSCYKFP